MNFNKLIKDYKIEIPMLQRDYAQGRDDDKTKEIRDEFLNSIFAVLKGEKERLHLDFVYGSKKGDKFIPLDGQQRLTTLFLLYWYFGFNEMLKDGEESKFVYETRASSREFCDMLVNLERKDLQNDEISAQIKDNAKFLPFWQNDPTVKSMLTMLDDIHEKAKDEKAKDEKAKDEKAKDENIKSENLENIDFDFLDMGEYKLTDELYIKMNARGKRLTEFENFKAKFEELLEKSEFKNLSDEFKNKIDENKDKNDKNWAKTFWNFRDRTNEKEDDYNPAKSVDDAFMSYFYLISEMLFYKINENTQKEAKDDKKEEFDKNKALKIYKNSKENIMFLFRALDNVDKIEKYSNEIFKSVPIYWGKKDTKEIKENTDTKVFPMEIEKFGYYEKVIYFIIISNYGKENTKDLVRKARNIMCSIKQPDRRGGVTFTSNLRAQDIYSILNFIGNNEVNFTRNKELFKEKNEINENLQNIQETIYKLEDSEIFQGDLGAVYKIYGNDIEKYKNLLNNINNIFNVKTDTGSILGMFIEKNIDFIWHGYTNIGDKYHIGSGLKDCWNFIFSNNDEQKYKDIISLFGENENLNPKNICKDYIKKCENMQKRDWRLFCEI